MFWGLIMEPNKRYTQVVEKPFHISQAAMDASTGDNEACQVMVVVDGKNFLVCTLQKNKCIQVPLDLYFKSGDSISFLTNGKCNVHLTGYLDPEFEDVPSDEEESGEEEEEEVPALVPTKGKRKLENNVDASANKKAKVTKQDKKSKQPAAADSSDSDSDDEEDQLQKILDGEDIDTDENDDSFKVNTSAEGDDDSDEDDYDEEEEEDEEDEEENDTSKEADTTLDTSKEETIDMSKLSKSQKRRLKKKLAQQNKDKPQMNGTTEKPKKEGQQKEKAEKKKPEKPESAKKEPQESVDKKEKKSLSGGVSIEDTKVGSGPVAKQGKVVMVYYEGRLKSNNKMFDNCLKGPGFKFRLGGKEVISGWDVGIAGMKVGGKRRIVCPPSMAYGAKGSPPVIPPNSTLVFDVELKNVK